MDLLWVIFDPIVEQRVSNLNTSIYLAQIHPSRQQLILAIFLTRLVSKRINTAARGPI